MLSGAGNGASSVTPGGDARQPARRLRRPIAIGHGERLWPTVGGAGRRGVERVVTEQAVVQRALFRLERS